MGTCDRIKESLKYPVDSTKRQPEPWPWRCCTDSLQIWPAGSVPRRGAGPQARGKTPGWPRQKPPAAAG